jgi:hypothetical protein
MVEIVTLAGNVENTDITLEADDCELDGLDADLPKLGQRLRYLTLKVIRRPTEGFEPGNVMTIPV